MLSKNALDVAKWQSCMRTILHGIANHVKVGASTAFYRFILHEINNSYFRDYS